jgi:hypothetical protein
MAIHRLAEPSMPPRPLLLALALASAALAVAAAPKPSEPARAAVLQAVADCRKLTEDAQRLACYDKAVAALDQAETKGQVVVIDREQVKEVRRQAFGLTLPAFTLFNRGPVEDHIDRITIEVAEAHRGAERKWIMTSTDGVVWAQADDESVENEPHPGSKVAIRHAALGSYFCNIDGQRAVRCERRR